MTKHVIFSNIQMKIFKAYLNIGKFTYLIRYSTIIFKMNQNKKNLTITKMIFKSYEIWSGYSRQYFIIITIAFTYEKIF